MPIRVIIWPFAGFLASISIIGVVLLTVLLAIYATKTALSTKE